MSGIPAWAVKGAKVVCVRSAHGPRMRPAFELVEGTVYTLARVFTDDEGIVEGVYVDLIEAGNGWYLNRFRPLVTRSQEQDVATFAPLLKTDHRATRKQGVDA